MSWRKTMLRLSAIAGLLSAAAAISLNVHDVTSIRRISSTLAYTVMGYYKNNATSTVPDLVGTFPYPPYYWWESGAAWGAMIDYWAYTGDTTYQKSISEALLAQVGPNYDFIMPNQAFDEGNDDQIFWVLTALSALEYAFPALPCPPGTSTDAQSGTYCPTSYLALSMAVFDLFVKRWNHDAVTCGGGLDWQFYESNAGFHYKSSISNGGFFQLAARLARYTNNATYAQWAEKSFSWCQSVGLVGGNYEIFDGTDDTINCSRVNHIQWSYNAGIFTYGAAVMYNYTNASPEWIVRLSGLLETTGPQFFGPFPNSTNVMYESSCELGNTCNNDQYSFKAYLARWMAKAAVLAPYVGDFVNDLLETSALGAANSCADNSGGVTCGTQWYTGSYDGQTGLGQQLSALECVQALLANGTAPPPTYEISVAGAQNASPSIIRGEPSATMNVPVASMAFGSVVKSAQMRASTLGATSVVRIIPSTTTGARSGSSVSSANPTVVAVDTVAPVPVEATSIITTISMGMTSTVATTQSAKAQAAVTSAAAATRQDIYQWSQLAAAGFGLLLLA